MRIRSLLLVLAVAAALPAEPAAAQHGSTKRDADLLAIDSCDALPPEVVARLVTSDGSVPDATDAWAVVIGRIVRTLNRMGFLEAGVTVERDVGVPGSRPLVHVNCGRQFVVARLEIVGNDGIRDSVLKTFLLVREGQPFDEALLEATIARLNEVGCLESLDRSNIEVRRNAARATVNVTIRVVERPDRVGLQAPPN